MSEEKIESIIRGFVEVLARRDIEKTLSFLADDVLWVCPEGTFKGKEEVKRLLTGEAQAVPELKIKDAGIGIMVKGNKAVYEYDFEGITSEGMKFKAPAIDVYEFSGEKIQQLRYVFDRLNVCNQVVKRWLPRKMVSIIVNRYQKSHHL